MRAERFSDVGEFTAAVGAFLAHNEALNNLPLGIMSTLRTNPGHYREPYLAAAVDGDEVVAVAMRTPPHNLILAHTDRPEALAVLADDAIQAFGTLPGVVGPQALALQFMELWQARTGQRGVVQVGERIYEAKAVTWPRAVSGSLRQAAESDRPWLVDWFEAFHSEAATGMGDPRQAAERGVERFLQDDTAGLWLWQDPEPVSLVGSSGPTGTGLRVGPVYTPRTQRGHGYASWLTAEVTQLRLSQGYGRVFLYTDLANSTSNKIYQAVGYRPVGDAAQCQFRGPETEG